MSAAEQCELFANTRHLGSNYIYCGFVVELGVAYIKSKAYNE